MSYQPPSREKVILHHNSTEHTKARVSPSVKCTGLAHTLDTTILCSASSTQFSYLELMRKNLEPLVAVTSVGEPSEHPVKRDFLDSHLSHSARLQTTPRGHPTVHTSPMEYEVYRCPSESHHGEQASLQASQPLLWICAVEFKEPHSSLSNRQGSANHVQTTR